MVDKEVVEWVKKHRAKGYSQEQLFSYLSQKGYSSREIDEAFDKMSPISVLTVDKSHSRKKLIVAVAVVIVLLILVAAAYLFVKSEMAAQIVSKFSGSSDQENAEYPDYFGEENIDLPDESMQTFIE